MNFPFETNGKFIILGVPILKHIRVCDFLADKALTKWGLLLKKEFAPPGANSFLEELTPIEKGGKNESYRVVPLESKFNHCNQSLCVTL